MNAGGCDDQKIIFSIDTLKSVDIRYPPKGHLSTTQYKVGEVGSREEEDRRRSRGKVS